MKRLLVIGTLLFLSIVTYAAMNPFVPIFSNPNVSYRVVATKYMNVVYEPGCEWAVYQFLKNCDNVYSEVTNFYDVQPFSKLTVVFEDDTDFVNSLADPFDNVIYIFLNSSESGFFTQDFKEWVTFVFTHELTHILLTQMGGLPTLRVLGNPLSTAYNAAFIPAYLQEGLAQYSETHFNAGSGRLNDPLFEMYLAGLVFSGRFKGLGGGGSYDSNGWYPIGAPYMLGGSFVRYVVETYGEKTLKKAITNLSTHHLLGVANAFEKATGVDFGKLIHQWMKSVKEDAKRRKSNSSLEGIQLTHSGRWTAFVSTASSNEVFFYSESSNVPPSVRSYIVSNSTFKEIRSIGGFLYQGGYIRSMSISPNGKKLAFVKLVSENGGFKNYARCFVLNLKSGNVKVLPIKRLLEVAWISNEALVYSQESGGLYSLKEYDLSDGTMKILMPPSEMVITSLFANSKKILFSANVNGKEDIYELQDGKIEKIIGGDFSKLDPYLTRDGKYLLFSAAKPNRDGIYNIYALDIKNNTFYKVTNVELGAFRPMVIGEKLFYAGYTSNGYNLFVLDRWLSTAKKVNYFTVTETPYKNEVNLTTVFLSVEKKSKSYSPPFEKVAAGLVPLISFSASNSTVKATYTAVAFDLLRTKLGWNNFYAFGSLSTDGSSDFIDIGMNNYGRYSLSANLFVSQSEKIFDTELSYPITSMLFAKDLLIYPAIGYSVKENEGKLSDELEFKGRAIYAPTFVPNNILSVNGFYSTWSVRFSPLKPATPLYALEFDTSIPLFYTVSKIGCAVKNGAVKLFQMTSFPNWNVDWYDLSGVAGLRYVNFAQYSIYDFYTNDFTVGFQSVFDFEAFIYSELKASVKVSYSFSKREIEYGIGLNF